MKGKKENLAGGNLSKTKKEEEKFKNIEEKVEEGKNINTDAELMKKMTVEGCN